MGTGNASEGHPNVLRSMDLDGSNCLVLSPWGSLVCETWFSLEFIIAYMHGATPILGDLAVGDPQFTDAILFDEYEPRF